MKSSTIVIEPRQVVRILGFIKDSFARHWTILAFIFLYLSLDEAASLHEQLIKPMRRLLGEDGLLAEGEALHGIWIQAWIIAGLILVALVGLSYFRFLSHLPRQTKRLFSLAALLYVGGAIGFEAASGIYGAHQGKDNLTYNLIVTVEETLEMIGITVFIYGLLCYIGLVLPGTSLHIKDLRTPQRATSA